MKTITRVEDLPSTMHYAALIDASVHIPGDQRSIDHPGHGYSASNQSYLEYKVFKDAEEMTKWVQDTEVSRQQGYGPKAYKIIEVAVRAVKTTVSVI